MEKKLCEMTEKYAGQHTTSITVEIPVELLDQVKKAASLEDLDYQALINCYVENGLSKSQTLIRQKEFAEQAEKILKEHGVKAEAITDIIDKVTF